MAMLSHQLPVITASAEAAAAHAVAHPNWVLRFPGPYQPAFTDEFVARSGGLRNWGTSQPEEAASGDMVLYAVRSWEEDGEEAQQVLADYRRQGWLTVLIASRAGMPANLPFDYLVENGAYCGSAEYSPANVIANIILGWMWCCEFTGALTRHGVHPHVYQSVFLPGADEFNATLTPKHGLPPCAAPQASGALGQAYFDRIQWLLAAVAGPRIQQQIGMAADIIAGHLLAGGRVLAACFAHAVPGEMEHQVQSPFLSLGVPTKEEEVKQKARTGDLLIFFGYIGLSSKYYDHGKWFRDAGLRLITSFVRDPHPGNGAPDALAHIDPSWQIGDAKVEIPFPPGKMAPMSVVNQLLLFRTLENSGAGNTGERLADDVYPSIVFFQDTYGINVERVLVAGVVNLQEVLPALESQTGARVQELVSASQLGVSAGSLQRSELAGVVGALIG
jgi:hypothetical protein